VKGKDINFDRVEKNHNFFSLRLKKECTIPVSCAKVSYWVSFETNYPVKQLSKTIKHSDKLQYLEFPFEFVTSLSGSKDSNSSFGSEKKITHTEETVFVSLNLFVKSLELTSLIFQIIFEMFQQIFFTRKEGEKIDWGSFGWEEIAFKTDS
jgi:hypothetical protein